MKNLGSYNKMAISFIMEFVIQSKIIQMSLKDLRKHQKSKKCSDFYSQKQEDRLTDSDSSSIHIQQLIKSKKKRE